MFTRKCGLERVKSDSYKIVTWNSHKYCYGKEGINRGANFLSACINIYFLFRKSKSWRRKVTVIRAMISLAVQKCCGVLRDCWMRVNIVLLGMRSIKVCYISIYVNFKYIFNHTITITRRAVCGIPVFFAPQAML